MAEAMEEIREARPRRFRPYPEYRDSGVEWLRKIPSHWNVMMLKRLANLCAGNAITADSIEDSGEFPVFGGNGIRGFTSFYTHEGDFPIIGRQGALCGCVNFASGRFWASEHAVVAAPAADTDPRWLSYVLQAMSLNSYSQSAAQPGLAVDTVAALSVPAPNCREQRAIASFLDRETAKIDGLMAKKEYLIELLQEKRIALITRAVTQGLNPNVPMKDSGAEWLSEIPAHWEVKKLKSVTTVQTGITLGKTYDSRRLMVRPYLRVANVQDGYLDLDDIAEIEIPFKEAGRYDLRAGDVLLTEGGDFDKLGRGYVWESQISGCLHQNHIFAVRPNQASLRPQFLSALMSSGYGRAYFTATSKQSTNLASTNSTKLGNFPLPLPDTDEQDGILRHISEETGAIDQMKERAEQGIERLKEFRTALTSAAVTGKIDVREEAE